MEFEIVWLLLNFFCTRTGIGTLGEVSMHAIYWLTFKLRLDSFSNSRQEHSHFIISRHGTG